MNEAVPPPPPPPPAPPRPAVPRPPTPGAPRTCTLCLAPLAHESNRCANCGLHQQLGPAVANPIDDRAKLTIGAVFAAVYVVVLLAVIAINAAG